MPKLKTKKNARKRIRISKNGKIKHFRAGRGHLLTGKRSKRKRMLGKPGLIEGGEKFAIRHMLPYGA